MKKDVQFFELLQKWLRGDFGNKDEKELNMMLNKDDFQREAMEGYQALSEVNHEVNLETLKQKIRGKSKPIATPVLSLQRMLSAAAVFALLVAAFWFIPRILDRKQGEIAQHLPVLEQKEIPEVTSMEGNEAPKLDKMIEKNPTLGGKIEDKELVKPSSSNPQKDNVVSIVSSSGSVTSTATISEEVELKMPAYSSNQTTTDDLDDINAERKRESVPGRVASPEVAAIPAPATPSKTNADIAVAKRKSKATASAKKSESPKEDVTYNETDTKPNMEALKDKNEEIQASSEPAGGWEAFNEYCRTNARLTDNARNNNVSGVVRLQFSVNNNGDPINFLTIKSLGYGCDEEAIRLVKDFEWIRGKNGLVNVEIKFAR
jgi:hypothetical protein